MGSVIRFLFGAAVLAVGWCVLWLVTLGQRSHLELTSGLHIDVSLWQWLHGEQKPTIPAARIR